VPAITLFERGGLAVVDYRCDAQLHERPVAERHPAFALAYVRKGSFGYRVRGAAYELVPGSILLGAPGDEYLCTHDHVCGDECLSIQLQAELVESIGGAQAFWQLGSVPPIAELVVAAERVAQALEGWGGPRGGGPPPRSGLDVPCAQTLLVPVTTRHPRPGQPRTVYRRRPCWCGS
jgi:hypothetical protein